MVITSIMQEDECPNFYKMKDKKSIQVSGQTHIVVLAKLLHNSDYKALIRKLDIYLLYPMSSWTRSEAMSDVIHLGGGSKDPTPLEGPILHPVTFRQAIS